MVHFGYAVISKHMGLEMYCLGVVSHRVILLHTLPKQNDMFLEVVYGIQILNLIVMSHIPIYSTSVSMDKTSLMQSWTSVADHNFRRTDVSTGKVKLAISVL